MINSSMKPGLAVIDMQNIFFRTPERCINRKQLIENINFMIRYFSDHKWPIYMVVTEHDPDRTTWTLNMLDENEAALLRGSDEASVVDGIVRTSFVKKIAKTRMDAFLNTDFRRQLANDAVDLLICGGVYTYGCVYHTAIGAYERNIRSIIALDCLSDYRPDSYPVLSDMLLKFYAGHGSVMNNQEIVEYLSHHKEVPIDDTLAGRKDTVSLRKVTEENLKSVLNLEVTKEQEKFVASNARSIAEAYFSEHAWFRAIYADETPVGFLMISDMPEKAEYYLWRFMIDARYQGKGYGRKALELLIDYVKTRPNAKVFYTSHRKGKGGPEGFYLKIGFRHTGKVEHGEFLMKLEL